MESAAAKPKPRQILDAPVTVGMFLIRGFLGQGEADERDNGRARVGQVVEGVRDDGDRTGHRPGKILRPGEQKVEKYPIRPAELAICPAHGRVAHIVRIFDENFSEQF